MWFPVGSIWRWVPMVKPVVYMHGVDSLKSWDRPGRSQLAGREDGSKSKKCQPLGRSWRGKKAWRCHWRRWRGITATGGKPSWQWGETLETEGVFNGTKSLRSTTFSDAYTVQGWPWCRRSPTVLQGFHSSSRQEECWARELVAFGKARHE